MKKLFIVAATAFLCAGTIGALAEEQYNFNFYNSSDAAGTSFAFPGISGKGCAEIGYLKTEWSEEKTFSEILADFTSLTPTEGQTTFTSANEFALAYNYTPPTGTDISGKTVYAFVGNGATRATSTTGAFFAFKAAAELITFSVFDIMTGSGLDTLALGDSETLLGSDLPTPEILFGSIIDGTTEITLAAIPEPSMFGLLAGLGALALVGSRRRRK